MDLFWLSQAPVLYILNHQLLRMVKIFWEFSSWSFSVTTADGKIVPYQRLVLFMNWPERLIWDPKKEVHYENIKSELRKSSENHFYPILWDFLEEVEIRAKVSSFLFLWKSWGLFSEGISDRFRRSEADLLPLLLSLDSNSAKIVSASRMTSMCVCTEHTLDVRHYDRNQLSVRLCQILQNLVSLEEADTDTCNGRISQEVWNIKCSPLWCPWAQTQGLHFTF